MIKTLEIPHTFPNGRTITNPYFGRIYIISREAAQERKENWIEVHGFNVGSSVVTHSDWAEVLADADSRLPNQYQQFVCCCTEDGEMGMSGLIGRNQNGEVVVHG